MPKPLFRIKPYKNSKYKFVVRGKIDGKWTRRYFISEAEAKAFAKEQNSALADSPDRQAARRGQASTRLQQPSLIELADVTTPAYRGPRILRYLGDSWCIASAVCLRFDAHLCAERSSSNWGLNRENRISRFANLRLRTTSMFVVMGLIAGRETCKRDRSIPEIYNEVVEYKLAILKLFGAAPNAVR